MANVLAYAEVLCTLYRLLQTVPYPSSPGAGADHRLVIMATIREPLGPPQTSPRLAKADLVFFLTNVADKRTGNFLPRARGKTDRVCGNFPFLVAVQPRRPLKLHNKCISVGERNLETDVTVPKPM